MKPVVDEISEAFKVISKTLEAQDQRQTSISIGTSPRFEAKIYVDPSKPQEAAEIVKTAVNQLYLGQVEIEAAKAKLDAAKAEAKAKGDKNEG